MMVEDTTIEVGPNEVGVRWGTWEELILGGAVLRHGTQDWNVVALELRARTLYPYCFTPEACKAKYENLRQRYCGCTAWFDELRRKRVAELKRELEKSEDSIGCVDPLPLLSSCASEETLSLESKIKRLKAESGHQVDQGSSQPDSPALVEKLEVDESFGKDATKDGLSAGSFTLDTSKICSSECQTPAAASVAQRDTKPEISSSSELEKGPTVDKSNERVLTVKKRRGKRKRKDCERDAKEGSIGESDNLGSATAASASRSKETSTSECNQIPLFYGTDDNNRALSGLRGDDLMRIFDSIAQNEVASVFRHRLDGQKRARYKKIIRQHFDFGMIRSRIVTGSIKSAKELLRDLLLLANNALVFYSRRTREYKSAFTLRDVVMKAYRQHCNVLYNKPAPGFLSLSPLCNPPGKPRSARPRPRPHSCKDKLSAKLHSADNIVGETQLENRKSTDADSNTPLQSLLSGKLSRRPVNVKRGPANTRPKTPLKEKKKRPQQT